MDVLLVAYSYVVYFPHLVHLISCSVHDMSTRGQCYTNLLAFYIHTTVEYL